MHGRGATAPSLHDIHPTPLSPLAPGVDSLATVIDNALNDRQLMELPRAFQAGVAFVLCLALAGLAQRKSLDNRVDGRAFVQLARQ